jgi:hypothetical protein
MSQKKQRCDDLQRRDIRKAQKLIPASPPDIYIFYQLLPLHALLHINPGPVNCSSALSRNLSTKPLSAWPSRWAADRQRAMDRSFGLYRMWMEALGNYSHLLTKLSRGITPKKNK